MGNQRLDHLLSKDRCPKKDNKSNLRKSLFSFERSSLVLSIDEVRLSQHVIKGVSPLGNVLGPVAQFG